MKRRALAAAALLLPALAACGGDESATAGDVDVSHVHGLGVAPDGEGVLIATHAGLVSYVDGKLGRAGDLTSDLMGFSGDGDRLYASGHPGVGEEGDFALGLITSADGGASWQPVSLAGKADFHALDAWSGGLVGYDGLSGSLLLSEDEGATWSQLPLDAPVADLAAAEDGRIVATTQAGLRVSEDAGRTFEDVDGAPPLVLVDFTRDGRLVGIDTSGRVHSSDDLTTWEAGGEVGSEFTALTTAPDGRVWVATTDGLRGSTDEGATFTSAVDW